MAVNNSIYRAYALFLIKNLSRILKDGIGMDIDIYPCSDTGNTVVVVVLKSGSKSSFQIVNGETLKSSLYKAGIDRFVFPLEGVRFEGNNTFVDSEKIVYVKDNKKELFSEEAVMMDVFKIVKRKLGKL